MARNRGSGVGVTGIGGVGALRSVQRIEAEGTISSSGVTSSGIEVWVMLPRAMGLGVGLNN